MSQPKKSRMVPGPTPKCGANGICTKPMPAPRKKPHLIGGMTRGSLGPNYKNRRRPKPIHNHHLLHFKYRGYHHQSVHDVHPNLPHHARARTHFSHWQHFHNKYN